MCEKVEALFNSRLQQAKMNDLFSYVVRGGMSLDFAAKEANLPPAEFAAQMRQNGYPLPQPAGTT